MTELPYQTFGSPNRVWIGADAHITEGTQVPGAEHAHSMDVANGDGVPLLALFMTPEGAEKLRNFLTAALALGDDDTPDTSDVLWAARDLAALALHEATEASS